MKRTILACLCLLATGYMVAQGVDPSNLSLEQQEMYKSYIGQSAVVKDNVKPIMVERNLGTDTTVATDVTDTTGTDAKPGTGNVVFGSELFSSQNLTFEPKLNIATPPKYVLGTYDEVLIDISGLYEAIYTLKVSPEGTIRIPNVGVVKVSGMKMEDATRLISNRIGSIYAGVSTGKTHVNVTLGNIRSIQVAVVGEATRPGTYTLPSLATTFNALYACGGPNSLGTMRDIQLVRNDKVIGHIDVYRYLIDGILTDNLVLQDGDIIRIDPFKVRVTIKGAVKRMGVYEALPNETLGKLVTYAGGFSDNAYKTTINLFRLTEKERKVVDVSGDQIDAFALQSGDQYTVATTFDKFENRVDINGYIYRPGAYALQPGMTVGQLINKAGGLKEEAYLNMAYITRKKENKIPEIISFNLGGVVNGSATDVLLQKDDKVEISSLFDFREGESVSIWGAVKSPGKFPLIENISLKDLIFKAHGFTEMASTDSVELIRIIKDTHTLATTNRKTMVMKFALDKDLNFKPGQSDILLENGDQVIVRTISGYEGIRMVRMEGEVLQPGDYNITSKSERISDLIKRAGGLSRYAYSPGAYLLRSEKPTGVEQKLKTIMAESAKKQMQSQGGNNIDLNLIKQANIQSIDDYSKMDSMQQTLSGSAEIDAIFDTEGIVGIDLTEILKDPGSKNDLFLEEGDVIFVPRTLQTVRVMGEVLFPTYVRFEPGMSLSSYVNSAGGFTNRAQKKRAFVLNANGTAKGTKNFLFFRTYPNVTPGARIIIPEKPAKIKLLMSPTETISLIGTLTTLATLLFSVLK